MADATDAREQRNLPFPEGEASHAERWNDLMIALSRIGRRCDLVLKDFVQWVFRATDGGRRGTLQKSYARLAERPSGLCCSTGKVRSTVELAGPHFIQEAGDWRLGAGGKTLQPTAYSLLSAVATARQERRGYPRAGDRQDKEGGRKVQRPSPLHGRSPAVLVQGSIFTDH